MAFLLFYLALTCCRFESGFAVSALFSASDDLATGSALLLDGGLWDTANENLFDVSSEALGDISDEALWDPEDLFSFCIDHGIGQPSKVRARDEICPLEFQAPSTPQLQIPKLPILTDVENAVTKKPQKNGPDRTVIKVIPVNGRDMRTDDPKYYCVKFAEQSYTIPVCGSGYLTDRIDKMPPYYARIENSQLSQSSLRRFLARSLTNEH